MLDYVTLEDRNGVAVPLHRTATRALAKADGLVGLPGVRAVVRDRPNGHGSLNRTKRLTDRLVELEGEIWGSSQQAAFAEFDVVGGALLDALDEPRLLRYRRGGDGLELQTLVQLASDVKAPLKGGGRFLKYQVQLRASDPRAYAQSVTTAQSATMGEDGGGLVFPVTWPATFLPGSSGQAVFSNQGSAATPPVFRLYGRLVNPTVRLLPDGPEVVLFGEVAAGDFLELDVANRTIRLNGNPSANRLGMRDFAQTTWFELPRGSGTVRLLADDADPGAYLEMDYRHAYV